MGIYQGRAKWSRPNPDRLPISGRFHQSEGFEPLDGSADGSEVLFQSSGKAIPEPPVARLGRGSQPVQEVHRGLRDSFEHQTAIGSSDRSGAGGALCWRTTLWPPRATQVDAASRSRTDIWA